MIDGYINNNMKTKILNDLLRIVFCDTINIYLPM